MKTLKKYSKVLDLTGLDTSTETLNKIVKMFVASIHKDVGTHKYYKRKLNRTTFNNGGKEFKNTEKWKEHWGNLSKFYHEIAQMKIDLLKKTVDESEFIIEYPKLMNGLKKEEIEKNKPDYKDIVEN